ncbi:MAG: adenylosuccinate synthase [Acidobacteria bacterium]|nr:MAG: adenylosuccinate synthase [Acidobacteriota bacterium]
MKTLIVVGAQWGDEGKGKIVDVLSEQFDIVARYQGGHNAGHTVKVGDHTFVLHLIPSGIIHPGKVAVIGHGLVIDPAALLREMEDLRRLGIEVTPERLRISERAHLILPYHRAMEVVIERQRGARKVGTTMRGIGPAYVTKVGRHGIRVGDLLDPERLREKIEFNVAYANRFLQAFDAELFDADTLYASYGEYGRQLAPYVTDTIAYLQAAVAKGQSILFEGAQGTMLDIDFGTYPYVTSSTAVAAGAAIGTGVPVKHLTAILGVMKAYTTRVGGGPFPTELHDDVGTLLRERGVEFGASTGRPRRCGWFDSFAVRYAVRVNGFDALALTKLDVLDVLDEIKICIGYRYRGERLSSYPFDAQVLEHCEPIYESMPGWKTPTLGLTRLEELPRRARDYIDRLSELVGCPISLISTGGRRRETILVPGSTLPRLLGMEP